MAFVFVDLEIAAQDGEVKSLKSNVRSLLIAMKPLGNLNKRILIEKFRLYIISSLFSFLAFPNACRTVQHKMPVVRRRLDQ
ncbi:unnamed protein product [Rotaria sp. Silwood1]|nr:unnamed protein product [Rotaria sp. Silwood1]CAF1242667.1 unnamed protein product [Rotaria sp. Silwood1]CAF1245400.1 unnamed protein product [Rotaria sp. Silwood1]CAF3537034.1 unnamed protein product [Rotaria sp. Silwood1]CAF4729788.1 unnamed protein product [Rotaria sp. Silwood1]